MKYEVVYNGKWLSINAAYSSNRWNRTKQKNEYKEAFKPLIQGFGITDPITQYRIDVRYWSKLDSLNVAAGIKIFEDTMVQMNLLVNDDKRYQKGVSITPDASLPHNTYFITITSIENDDE